MEDVLAGYGRNPQHRHRDAPWEVTRQAPPVSLVNGTVTVHAMDTSLNVTLLSPSL